MQNLGCPLVHSGLWVRSTCSFPKTHVMEVSPEATFLSPSLNQRRLAGSHGSEDLRVTCRIEILAQLWDQCYLTPPWLSVHTPYVKWDIMTISASWVIMRIQ